MDYGRRAEQGLREERLINFLDNGGIHMRKYLGIFFSKDGVTKEKIKQIV